MAESKIVNRHEKAVRDALEAFCREYTGRETDWHVETWLHPLTRSVESVAVLPEFERMGIAEAVNTLRDYLRAHLAPEDYRKLGLAKPMTPYEYEHSEWGPSEVELAFGLR